MYSGVYSSIQGLVSASYDTLFEVSLDITLPVTPDKHEIIANLRSVFPDIRINDFLAQRAITRDYFEALLGHLTLKFTLFDEEKMIRIIVVADKARLDREENERMIPSDFILLARLLRALGLNDPTLTLNCEPSTLAARLWYSLAERGLSPTMGQRLLTRGPEMNALISKIKQRLQSRSSTLMFGAFGSTNSITDEGDPLTLHV